MCVHVCILVELAVKVQIISLIEQLPKAPKPGDSDSATSSQHSVKKTEEEEKQKEKAEEGIEKEQSETKKRFVFWTIQLNTYMKVQYLDLKGLIFSVAFL